MISNVYVIKNDWIYFCFVKCINFVVVGNGMIFIVENIEEMICEIFLIYVLFFNCFCLIVVL